MDSTNTTVAALVAAIQERAPVDTAPQEFVENGDAATTTTITSTSILAELGPAIRESMTKCRSLHGGRTLSFAIGRHTFDLGARDGEIVLVHVSPEGTTTTVAKPLTREMTGYSWDGIRRVIRFRAGISKQDRISSYCHGCGRRRRVAEGTECYTCKSCGAFNTAGLDEWAEKWGTEGMDRPLLRPLSAATVVVEEDAGAAYVEEEQEEGPAL